MDVLELAQRLEALERRQRRWRAAGTALAVLAGLLLVAGGRSGRVLETERIRIVDASGRIGVEIDADSVTLTGRADPEGGRLRARLQPSGLEVVDEQGDEIHAVLELNTRELDLIDYRQERRAVVTPAVLGLQLGIHASPPAWVAALRDGGLEVRDREGTLRASLGLPAPATDTDATLALYAPDGRLLWQAP